MNGVGADEPGVLTPHMPCSTVQSVCELCMPLVQGHLQNPPSSSFSSSVVRFLTIGAANQAQIVGVNTA